MLSEVQGITEVSAASSTAFVLDGMVPKIRLYSVTSSSQSLLLSISGMRSRGRMHIATAAVLFLLIGGAMVASQLKES